MFDDYPVKYLGDEEVEAVADDVRQRIFRSSLPKKNLLDGLRRFSGLQIIPLPDEQMGRYEAYVSYDRKRIFCKASIFQNCANGDPRASGIIAHELQIARAEFDRMSHCGWLIRDGKPVAWITFDHQMW